MLTCSFIKGNISMATRRKIIWVWDSLTMFYITFLNWLFYAGCCSWEAAENTFILPKPAIKNALKDHVNPPHACSAAILITYDWSYISRIPKSSSNTLLSWFSWPAMGTIGSLCNVKFEKKLQKCLFFKRKSIRFQAWIHPLVLTCPLVYV